MYAKNTFSVTKLTVEQQKEPCGISVLQPRFSWQLLSDKRDVMQTAYQIEVAATRKQLEKGKDIPWNSGRVQSDQSLLVAYRGASLKSGQDYYWRVTVWNNTGEKSRSTIHQWLMALLDSSEWQAQWIGLNDSTNLRLNGERTILPARYLPEFGIRI